MGIKNIQGNLNIDGNLTVQSKEVATQEWVNSVIAGKVDYLGLVANREELYNAAYAAGTKLTPGDYARASVDFTLPAYSSEDQGEQVHAGDILIFKSWDENDSPEPYIDYWDIIHTEDPGKYVTLDTDQTITGKKTFNGGFEAVDAVFNTCATFNGGMYLRSNNGKWLNIGPTGINGENENQQLYNVSFPTTTGTLATQEWVNEQSFGTAIQIITWEENDQ